MLASTPQEPHRFNAVANARLNGRNAGNRLPERSAAWVKRLGDAYKANDLPARTICERFGCSAHELTVLRDREGWPVRGRDFGLKKMHTARRGPKVKTLGEIVRERKAADAARTVRLYGPLAEDAAYLRRRDYTITAYHGGFIVDDKFKTAAELKALAARERRLEAADRPPAPPEKRRPGRPKGTKLSDAAKARMARKMRANWKDPAFRRRARAGQRKAAKARAT